MQALIIALNASLCAPGLFSSGAICAACPNNTFSVLAGSTQCLPCPVGLQSAPGSTACVCANGKEPHFDTVIAKGALSACRASRRLTRADDQQYLEMLERLGAWWAYSFLIQKFNSTDLPPLPPPPPNHHNHSHHNHSHGPHHHDGPHHRNGPHHGPHRRSGCNPVDFLTCVQ